MSNYFIEKQVQGYCIVKSNGEQVTSGAPHMKEAVYFKTKKEAEAFKQLIDIDTFTEKENWTAEHHALYETIPKIIQDLAGDLFELKWYSHCDYDGIMWEAENNFFDKPEHLAEFKQAYDGLVNEQKNLIYYAYEA